MKRQILVALLLMGMMITGSARSAQAERGAVQLDGLATPEEWRATESSVSGAGPLLAAGRPTVRLRITVDHESPERAPVGWPKAWTPVTGETGGDWRAFDRFEFLAMIRHTPSQIASRPRPLPMTLACKLMTPNGDRYTIVPVRFEALDAWTRVSMPIADIDNLAQLKGLMFYIAEKRYTHGETVDYYLGDFRLVRGDASASDEVVLLTPLPTPERPELRLEATQHANATLPLAIERGGQTLHEQTAEVSAAGHATLNLAALALSPGAYELVTSPRDETQRRAMTFRWTVPAAPVTEASNGGPQDTPTHHITRTTTPPRIDGDLGDEAWRQALTFDDFHPIDGTAGLDVPGTRAMLTFDDDALYLAFRCDEPLMDQLQVHTQERDGPTWKDDCVEIFLDPAGGRTSYAHLTVNAAGVLRDAWAAAPKQEDLGWESGASVSTRRLKDGWTAEIRLPIDQLPLVGMQPTWTFQLARSRQAMVQHLTMLTARMAGYHQPNQFERLAGFTFPQRPIRVVEGTLGELLPGVNLAHITLRNDSDEAEAATVVVRLEEHAPVMREFTVSANGVTECEVPWPLAPDDEGRVRLGVYWGERFMGGFDHAVEARPVLGQPDRQAFIFEPEEPLAVRLPVGLAAGSRPSAELRWELLDDAGQVADSGDSAVDGRQPALRLRPKSSGRHTLRVTLAWGDGRTASTEAPLYLVEGPFTE